MADVTRGGAAETEAPRTLLGRLGVVGPGIVVAVTGVGAGDMVTSLVAGTEYGLVLLAFGREVYPVIIHASLGAVFSRSSPRPCSTC